MSCVRVDLEYLQCDLCPERLSDRIDACPARWFFQHLGDKWSFPVLDCLAAGPMRFSHLSKSLDPISERMLILTLKKLEANGFVARGQTGTLPSQNTYQLTPLARSLFEHARDLSLWMNANAPAILEAYQSRTPARTTPLPGRS